MASTSLDLVALDFADHYWRAENGRIYSSRRLAVVGADDADFAAWQGVPDKDADAADDTPAVRRVPSAWPRQGGRQTQAALDAVLAYYGVIPGSSPETPVITTKADLFRRATDVEVDMIDTALKAAPLRERLIFEAAQHLDHADPLFADMRKALAGMFSDARADELLAPSAT